MKNINVFISENIGAVSKNVSIAPGIPEKKLNNAAKAFKCEDHVGSIIALFDNTLLGSGKDGLVFTGEKIIYRPSFSDPIDLHFSEFKSVDYVKNLKINDKGEGKTEEQIDITLKEGPKVTIKALTDCDYQKLAQLLKEAFSSFDKFEEENQLVTVDEMSEDLKVAYVKVVINMAFADDGEVDKKEYAEILSLMNRLRLSVKSRFELRSYIYSGQNLESLESLLEVIDQQCVHSHNKSVKISLVKDLIAVFMSVNDGSYKEIEFLTKNQTLFGVSDEEIEVVVMAIKNDFNMLREDFTDDLLTKSVKEVAAKASAVGLPLAAVYLSGSVIGLSAAGMTSGLATLGLGGLLGFSSMATGVGVVVLLGVGAYKGVSHLTGANELDKTKRRALMLNEMIKQTQSDIVMVIEDLNYLTIELNEAIESDDIKGSKIKKLMTLMSTTAGVADLYSKKSGGLQNSATKLLCPNILDDSKLKSLTKEPTQKQYYTLVMGYYEEQKVQQSLDGKTQDIKKMKLKHDIPTKDLEKLANIFDAIGYFKASDVLKGAASDIADKAKNKLTRMFS